MSDRLTLEQSERMTVLLASRDFDTFFDYCENAGFSYAEIVMMVASVCKTMMPKVTGDEREHPLDMWILEPTAFGAAPTPALQLLVAYANDDEAMAQAHLAVIANSPHSIGEALAELVKVAADLLNIWIEQQKLR